MKRFIVALALASTASTAACSQVVEESGSTSAASTRTINQPSDDVTVLQAWIGVDLSRRYESGYAPGVTFDHTLCHGFDCSSAAQAVLPSMLLGGFNYDESRSGLCETVEVRTVVKKAAFESATFKGLGLYLSRRTDYAPQFLYASKIDMEMHAGSGQVTLANGEAGLVHRFVVQGTCFGQGGNGSSLYSRNYELKPFAEYAVDGIDREVFRNWDNVASNYLLGRASDGRTWVQSFDRQSDLLRR